MLDIRLHFSVVELAANETLRIENAAHSERVSVSAETTGNWGLRIVRVHRNLILGGVADQTLSVREGYIRRRGAVTLVVGDDFDTVILPDADTAV